MSLIPFLAGDGAARKSARAAINQLLPRPEAGLTLTTKLTDPEPAFFVVAADLGSVNDSTAITVLEVGRAWEVTCQRAKFEPVPAEIKRTAELFYTVSVRPGGSRVI